VNFDSHYLLHFWRNADAIKIVRIRVGRPAIKIM
jgi:hypothetical protein